LRCATCELDDGAVVAQVEVPRLSPKTIVQAATGKTRGMTRAAAAALMESLRAEIEAFKPRPLPEQFAELKAAREKAHWGRATDPRHHLLRAARNRARKNGVKCTIEFEDIVVPERCPVLGIPLAVGRGKLQDGSPTVDRIIPRFGYVRGNIAVISWRANIVKNAGTAAEHRAVADWIDANENSHLFD
jgi:hypothetical protein